MKIKPCPFCGSEDTELFKVSMEIKGVDVDGWAVHCNECEARGPVLPIRTRARAAWNDLFTNLTFLEKIVERMEEDA